MQRYAWAGRRPRIAHAGPRTGRLWLPYRALLQRQATIAEPPQPAPDAGTRSRHQIPVPDPGTRSWHQTLAPDPGTRSWHQTPAANAWA